MSDSPDFAHNIRDSSSLKDPWSDPNNPRKITIDDVRRATNSIKSRVTMTSCTHSKAYNAHGMDLYLKNDHQQYTGSFKERGACYCLLLLPEEQKKIGVIAASLGNHGQGVSYHGMKMNIPVTIVMPQMAPMIKQKRCRDFQAKVVIHGKNMNEAKTKAMQLAKEQGLLFINGSDHPHVIAGQGSVGLEILEQVPNPDAVILPCGGGGLLAGVAVAIKALSPKTKIIGVEPETVPSFTAAIKNEGPIQVPIGNTLADGLAVSTTGVNVYATAAHLIDRIITLEEKWIALAILRLAEEEKTVVEGAGATPLAAILAGYLDEFLGKKVVIVLSGANIDTTLLGRVLERGLAAESRLIKFSVEILDRPGELEELTSTLSSLGILIKYMKHERTWVKDIFKVQMQIVCETHGVEDTVKLRKKMLDQYDDVIFEEEPLAIEDQSNTFF